MDKLELVPVALIHLDVAQDALEEAGLSGEAERVRAVMEAVRVAKAVEQ